ncbi:MAG: hypothetical protein IJI04_08225 [Lachnospiraceae bacterium]|nr:hypothetical protein [Lachnospiraceae bacterium]
MSGAAILSSNNFSYTIKEHAKKAHLFPRWVYERAGFTCRRHFLKEDELLFNGVKYSRTAADSILGRMGWTIEEERIPRTSGLLIRVTRVYHNGVLCSR